MFHNLIFFKSKPYVSVLQFSGTYRGINPLHVRCGIRGGAIGYTDGVVYAQPYNFD